MRAETFLTITLATLAAPSTAMAFCRTTTVAPPSDFEPGEASCFTAGTPLFHKSQCVPYHLSQRPSRSVAFADFSDALASGFSTWTSRNARCTPGIVAVEVAPVPATTTIVNYTLGIHEDNVIGFVSPWPHNDNHNTLSLTTITFQVDTGEIFDADMEINDDQTFVVTTAPPPDGYDFESVVTHEAGHFLGLAHSSTPTAIMNPSYTPGTTKRELDPDDELGICAIYPSRAGRVGGAGAIVPSSACDLSATSSSGTGGCGADPQITHGCSAAPSRTSWGSGAFLTALALTTTAAFARRRRADRR